MAVVVVPGINLQKSNGTAFERLPRVIRTNTSQPKLGRNYPRLSPGRLGQTKREPSKARVCGSSTLRETLRRKQSASRKSVLLFVDVRTRQQRGKQCDPHMQQDALPD